MTFDWPNESGSRNKIGPQFLRNRPTADSFLKATGDLQTANYRLAMLVRWTRRWGVVLFRSCGTHLSVTLRPPETQVSKTRRRIRFAVFKIRLQRSNGIGKYRFQFYSSRNVKTLVKYSQIYSFN